MAISKVDGLRPLISNRCGYFFFEQFPVDNQPVALFAQNQEIAKLDFLGGFAANDHVDVGLKEAQKLFIIGYLALSYDAFMCLFNSRGLQMAVVARRPPAAGNASGRRSLAIPMFLQSHLQHKPINRASDEELRLAIAKPKRCVRPLRKPTNKVIST